MLLAGHFPATPTLFDFDNSPGMSCTTMCLESTLSGSRQTFYPLQHATDSVVAHTAPIPASKQVGANQTSLQLSLPARAPVIDETTEGPLHHLPLIEVVLARRMYNISV